MRVILYPIWDKMLAADILTSLYQQPLWPELLTQLTWRTQAERADLLVRDAHGARRWNSANPAPRAEAQLPGLEGLRANRVYARAECASDIAPEGPGARFQYGRIVRISAPGWTAWLMIFGNAADFTAADGALLSSLTPHLAVSVGAALELEQTRIRLATADALLARAGIRWRTAGDAEPSDGLLLSNADNTRVVVSRESIELRPGAAEALEVLWDLSAKEAQLAVAIANGKSLVEAAEALGLTVETVRHYSKRIYAKTGARGLADLTRLVLTSVAALA